MPVIICPHCETGSDFTLQIGFADPLDVNSMRHVGSCRLCEGTVWFRLRDGDVEWHSPRAGGHAPPELPDEVKRAFEEALISQAADAPNAAGLMCRRAISEALKDKKAKKGDLPTQLQDLVDKYVITPDLKEWADHARIGGRIGAHGGGSGEWGEPDLDWLTAKDAEAVIEFCQGFFEYIYVLPKRNTQRRSATLDDGQADD